MPDVSKRALKIYLVVAIVGVMMLGGILQLALRPTPAPKALFTPTTAVTQTPTVTPTSLPVEITDAGGVTMRLVPAGAFVMGSDAEYAKDAQPAHRVTLPNFYMDVYEVTRGRYQACVTAGICSEARNLASSTAYYAEPDYPMAAVDWHQAKTYCEWRSAHLPSEAEWEKAARGTDGRTYPWGEAFDAQYVTTSYDPKTGGPTKVGAYEKGQSPYGMYDLAGGVWEWTADPFLAYPGNQDQGVYRAEDRVLRGGSWFYPDQYALSTWFRYASSPEVADGSFGFRCAQAAP